MDKSTLIIALLKCKGLGNTKVLKILKEHNFDFKLINENINNIFNNDIEEFSRNIVQAKEEIETNKKNGIDIITIFDSKYPSKLHDTTDPILYLYYIGDINLINATSIAIIGTRHPSDKGIKYSQMAGEVFGSKGYVVVSGLAIGCDMHSHIGCLNKNGKTIAILPSDLINVQPKSNSTLAKRIVDNGGLLISEYPVGSIINKFNYVKRDRIQSAISKCILVIESSENGGTMIAVNKSIKDGKKVFTLNYNKISSIKYSVDIEYPDDILLIEESLNDKKTNNIFQTSIFDNSKIY